MRKVGPAEDAEELFRRSRRLGGKKPRRRVKSVAKTLRLKSRDDIVTYSYHGRDRSHRRRCSSAGTRLLPGMCMYIVAGGCCYILHQIANLINNVANLTQENEALIAVALPTRLTSSHDLQALLHLSSRP